MGGLASTATRPPAYRRGSHRKRLRRRGDGLMSTRGQPFSLSQRRRSRRSEYFPVFNQSFMGDHRECVFHCTYDAHCSMSLSDSIGSMQ
ncbi:unnamed protein product [Urochloa humidicola]